MPSSVVILRVTKLRPGQQTTTLASVIFMGINRKKILTANEAKKCARNPERKILTRKDRKARRKGRQESLSALNLCVLCESFAAFAVKSFGFQCESRATFAPLLRTRRSKYAPLSACITCFAQSLT